MARFFFWVLVIGIGGALAYGIVVAASHFSPLIPMQSGTSPAYTVSYADFISLMLTAVSVILAALGFVVALIAVVGWNSIGDRVSTLAVSFLKESSKKAVNYMI